MTHQYIPEIFHEPHPPSHTHTHTHTHTHIHTLPTDLMYRGLLFHFFERELIK